jgi:two-component system sensor histidine kinase BaeS
VTGERNPLRSPLGRRLLAAFVLVAFSSVLVLSVAALVGTNQGLANAQRGERQQAADRTAVAVATAYEHAHGWAGADLSAAGAIADAAGARLVVQDADATMVWPGRGMGPGMRADTGAAAVVEAPVLVSGQQVGIVRLAIPTAVSSGRTVAWSWVIGAAVVALAAAMMVSGYVVRRLTRPLTAMADAARRFAAGERAARTTVDAPGELGEVAGAFDAMADEVVRAEQVRRSLAADVAHELRTPLAALQAGLEELRDGLRQPDAERLGVLHDQTLRLGRVVQDLADLSAAESAALSLHPTDTDLTQIARDALAAQHSQLDAAGVHVDAGLATPVPVHGDPDRLHQVITNLLTNAARYCRPGDRVGIHTYTDAASAVVDVADSGPGIPEDELPHVFDRLWRGQQAHAVTGSGIGLAVVRELVAAHGGTVTAMSPPTGGTTITIRVPLADRAARQSLRR